MDDIIRRAQKEKENAILSVVEMVESDSRIFERIVGRFVSEYCYELDMFVNRLSDILKDIKNGRIKRYSDLKLEIRALELATQMYKATEGLSVLGSHSDVAKANRQEKFHQLYASLKGSGTIPDKQAEVNKLIAQEIMVEKIMDRAHKVIGQKLKNANRILEAIKKVLTSQMIAKEVWRKEAPVYDMIDGEAEDDLETETRDTGEDEF